MVSLTALTMMSAIVIAQADSTSPNYEHLKALEPLVGEWVYEGALTEDLAGLNEGDEVRFQFSFRWILKKAVLRWEWRIASGEREVVSGIEHLGWNAKDRKVFSVMFATNGDMDTSEWSVEQNRFISHYSGALADGTAFRGDVVLTVLDEDTVTWKAVGHVAGDAAPMNSSEYRYRRKGQ
jgi:hypothetical protein